MKNSQISRLASSINYGDCFVLNEHRLIYGDSCEKPIINKLVGKDKINLLLCDIPYSISMVASKKGFVNIKKGDKDIQNDQEQTDEEYAEFNRKWLETIKPHLAEKNAYYIFNCDKMIFALREGIKQAGYKFSQMLIWIKNHAVMGRLNYLPQSELIAYGWFGTHKFYRSQDKNILFCPRPNKSVYHPTMKPLSLLRQLILNSTKVGDVVFDGFGGSGQVLFSCEQTKRKCLMAEIDKEYVATIIYRFERYSGKKVVKQTDNV